MTQSIQSKRNCPVCYKKNSGAFVTNMREYVSYSTMERGWICPICGFKLTLDDAMYMDNPWYVKIPFNAFDNTPWKSQIDYTNIDPLSPAAIDKFVKDLEYLNQLREIKNKYYGYTYSWVKECPQCQKELTDAAISAGIYRCNNCAKSAKWKFTWTWTELYKLERAMKTIQMCKTYQDTIVEIKIIGRPIRGWWKENAQPVIDFLKSVIPVSDREYDSNTNIWSFDVKYWEPIETIFTKLNWQIQVVASLSGKGNEVPGVHVDAAYAENFHYKQEVITTVESTESIAAQLSKFLGVAITTQDLNDLKKLYRQKALELHPDRGGDAAAMSELNRLWTLYCNTGVKQ